MEDSISSWPHVFDSLKTQLSAESPRVLLSECWNEQKLKGHCVRILTCSLVPESQYELLTGDQELDPTLATSGPYPCPRNCEYIPWFRILGTSAIPDDIEPLVLSWESNDQTVLQPDPGLLMTYGLMPRIEQDGLTHWDEPAKPTSDVLIVKPPSIYEFPDRTRSDLTILREYLQDYASLRQRSVVCIFFERWVVDGDEQLRGLLGGKQLWEQRCRDAYIRIQPHEDTGEKLRIEIRGHRLLMRPDSFPISEDANRFGELSWPGITGSVDDQNWQAQGMESVYVKDTVLGRFEGRPEFQIQPITGAVSYGNQWSVDFCNRVDRDLIQLELKKLYEGCSPDIVRHYHQYAVSPPSEKLEVLRQTRNIGVRAHDIVHSTLSLGEAIAGLATRLLQRDITSEMIVSIDRNSIEYSGWWMGDAVEPICRHVPISATRDLFLSRCKDLYRFIGEGLVEKLFREVLKKMGIDGELIKDLRSLRLMSQMIELVRLAKETGLDPVTDCTDLVSRYKATGDPSPCRLLFALNDLRMLDAHRPGKSFSSKLNNGLIAFEIDSASTASGYGPVIDQVYDKLSSELTQCADAFGS